MVTDESLRTTKSATATMFAVLIQVLEKDMPGVEAAFLERLALAYATFVNESDDLNGVELINWTRAMLTGFTLNEGYGDKLLEGQ